MTENTIVQYKVDSPYRRDSEGGIKWNDADLTVEWQTDKSKLSVRDSAMPGFNELTTPFV